MAKHHRVPTRDRSTEWWLGVAALCALGLGIRLAYVLVFRRHVTLFGDPIYYHGAANLLVTGHGFINPVAYSIDPHHRVLQGADFPPLFSVVLAAASLVGFKSVFAHQIWCCIIGTATVAVVALAAREVAGRRAGLIAALVAAAYPNFWINDGLIHAETLSLLLVALSVLVAYRLWHRPRILTAGVLGAVLALAILTRDEEALLVPLVLVPLTLLARSRPGDGDEVSVSGVEGSRGSDEAPTPCLLDLRRRLAMLGVGVLATLTVLAPWVGYNMSRFQDPVFVSTGLGVTLTTANCNTTYYGQYTGYWWLRCVPNVPASVGDESAQDVYLRHYALSYISHHEGRLPFLALARVGRGFGFYQPFQQIRLDSFFEKHPSPAALTGLWIYYGLFLTAIAGFVVLWRRRVTIIPLVGITATTVISMIVAFGQTRYRSPFEVVLAVLAGVVADAALTGFLRRRRLRSRSRRAYPVTAVAPPTIEPAQPGRDEPIGSPEAAPGPLRSVGDPRGGRRQPLIRGLGWAGT